MCSAVLRGAGFVAKHARRERSGRAEQQLDQQTAGVHSPSVNGETRVPLENAVFPHGPRNRAPAKTRTHRNRSVEHAQPRIGFGDSQPEDDVFASTSFEGSNGKRGRGFSGSQNAFPERTGFLEKKERVPKVARGFDREPGFRDDTSAVVAINGANGVVRGGCPAGGFGSGCGGGPSGGRRSVPEDPGSFGSVRLSTTERSDANKDDFHENVALFENPSSAGASGFSTGNGELGNKRFPKNGLRREARNRFQNNDTTESVSASKSPPESGFGNSRRFGRDKRFAGKVGSRDDEGLESDGEFERGFGSGNVVESETGGGGGLGDELGDGEEPPSRFRSEDEFVLGFKGETRTGSKFTSSDKPTRGLESADGFGNGLPNREEPARSSESEGRTESGFGGGDGFGNGFKVERGAGRGPGGSFQNEGGTETSFRNEGGLGGGFENENQTQGGFGERSGVSSMFGNDSGGRFESSEELGGSFSSENETEGDFGSSLESESGVKDGFEGEEQLDSDFGDSRRTESEFEGEGGAKNGFGNEERFDSDFWDDRRVESGFEGDSGTKGGFGSGERFDSDFWDDGQTGSRFEDESETKDGFGSGERFDSDFKNGRRAESEFEDESETKNEFGSGERFDSDFGDDRRTESEFEDEGLIGGEPEGKKGLWSGFGGVEGLRSESGAVAFARSPGSGRAAAVQSVSADEGPPWSEGEEEPLREQESSRDAGEWRRSTEVQGPTETKRSDRFGTSFNCGVPKNTAKNVAVLPLSRTMVESARQHCTDLVKDAFDLRRPLPDAGGRLKTLNRVILNGSGSYDALAREAGGETTLAREERRAGAAVDSGVETKAVGAESGEDTAWGRRSEDAEARTEFWGFLEDCAAQRGCALADPRMKPYSSRHFAAAPDKATCCAMSKQDVLPSGASGDTAAFGRVFGIMDDAQLDQTLGRMRVDEASRRALAAQYRQEADSFERFARCLFGDSGVATAAVFLDLAKNVWARMSDFMRSTVAFVKRLLNVVLRKSGTGPAGSPENPAHSTEDVGGETGRAGSGATSSVVEPGAEAGGEDAPDDFAPEGAERGLGSGPDGAPEAQDRKSPGFWNRVSEALRGFGRLVGDAFSAFVSAGYAVVTQGIMARLGDALHSLMQLGFRSAWWVLNMFLELAVWVMSSPGTAQLLLSFLNEVRKLLCWQVSVYVAAKSSGSQPESAAMRYSKTFGAAALVNALNSEWFSTAVQTAGQVAAGMAATAVAGPLSAFSVLSAAAPVIAIGFSAAAYIVSRSLVSSARLTAMRELYRFQVKGAFSLLYGLFFGECFVSEARPASAAAVLESALDGASSSTNLSQPALLPLIDRNFASQLLPGLLAPTADARV